MLKIFKNANDRAVKRYKKRVNEINKLETKYKAMDDEQLKASFNTLKESVANKKKSLDDALNDSFAITREASTRVLGMRHFDVQLIGGMVLHDGNIAEMRTGEGKTLVATLAVALNAMEDKGVHIVTVNDYLATRDATEMGVLYEFLGYQTGCISINTHDEQYKKAQYNMDITYGTNHEYGFDYLRDNMKSRLEDKVQRAHNYVIVDEVDSILIDEARTPLIISGEAQRDQSNYARANEIAKQLKPGKELPTKAGEPKQTTGDFIVDEKDRNIIMTEDGLQKAQDLFEVDNLYSLDNAILSHHLDQALKARYLFEKDINYVIKDGEIVIVDEFTGRLSEGRRYSDGLHQAIEAKEGVEIQKESQTLADITYQNYFRMYDKLSGMTGTAQTEATEFAQIYGLDVISIPTNVPIKRLDKNDLIYNTEREKLQAVALKVKELHEKGQPVLIGTASIEKSELIDNFLQEQGVPHNTLNAKNHEKEASIIESAGQKGAVTVATNMAGRGVDIKIDDQVKSLGGLFILGTERHESRRIDNQLRGRSGRQGDPGESQFFLSLDDNLLRIFGGDKIKSIMNRIGIAEGEYIDSKLVTRSVEKAQKRVEGMHYESRKNILEYDDVANHQRKAIYAFRNQLLDSNFDLTEKLDQNREALIENFLNQFEIFSGIPPEDYNIDGLVSEIKSQINVDIDKSKILNQDASELHKTLTAMLKEAYEEKMSPISPEDRREVESMLYLQTLDPLWRDHLYEMDVLKTGIGLRGYNQKDPLTEYKQESYRLFEDLVERIKIEGMKVIYNIKFNFVDPDTEQTSEQASEQINDTPPSNREAQIAAPEQETQAKPKRNDPCPCGSGKKYKQCCGKSGPKKGLIA